MKSTRQENWKKHSMAIKILSYGTFDMFHFGHVRLLKRLADLGDELIIGLSTDEFNLLKGKKTVIPYAHRREVLMACKYVDDVIPESSWEQKSLDIERLGISTFAMGDDWAGKFDALSELCNVLYLPRTQNVSTTEIRQLVNAVHSDKIQQLRTLVGQLGDQISKL